MNLRPSGYETDAGVISCNIRHTQHRFLRFFSVTLFFDTRYNVTSYSEETLLASRPIIITPIEQSIPDGFTVFSAAGMKQTAKLLAQAEHGLFSYYLMKGMEGSADGDKDKKITAGELHKYVLANVSRLQQNQTPELQGDANKVLVRW